MIKWIGQHIVSLIARFRDDVYLENLTESTQDHVVGIDDDGKLYKQDRGTTDSFTVEDGDTTDVVISNGKHWKFVEGGGININWTDTSTGSSTDEYDLTFTLSKTLSDLLADESHVIRGTGLNDVLIQSTQSLKFQVDYDESSTAGTHTFDFINGAGTTVATIDESGVPTFSIGGKGSAASSVIVDGGSGSLTSRTLSEFKSDASLSNVEDKSSATIRGEIVTSDIPALNASKVTGGTFDDARIPDLAASKVTSGTFDAARIPTLNQDTTGQAATAFALTSGDKTIEGNLRIGGSGDTSNNWITIDAQNGTDTTGGGICFYETGTDTVGAPQYGAKIVYNEDDDEFAIGTMHNNTFMRQLHMDRGSSSVRMTNAVIATTSTDGPFLFFQNDDTSVVDGQSLCRIIVRNADRGTGTNNSQIQWFATEDHDSDSCGTKITFTVTPNGNSQSETTAMTINQDSSLTVGGAITSGGNTVATTNLALDSFADSTSNSIGVGTIELGHASDTTISRVAAGYAQVEGETIVTTITPAMSSAQVAQPIATLMARRTITTAEMNDLHNTPVPITPAPGTNIVALPIGGMIRVDRASTNSGTGSLDFHYNGVTASYGTTSLIHFRRFNNGKTTDTVYNIVPNTGGVTTGTNLTDDVNSAIEVSLTSAATTDCFTSVDIYLTYQLIKIA